MKTKTIVKLSIAVCAIGIFIGVYFLTPLKEFLSLDKVVELTKDIPDNWISALLFLLIFFVGGALLIPIPLMAFAVSLVFDLWLSILIAIPGFLLASLSGYTLGRLFGTDVFSESVQKKIDGIKERVDDKGAWAVLALRMAPTPPFTVTSMISGAINIHLGKYVLGSTLGIAPLGLSAIFFGRSAIEMMQEPSGLAISTLVAAILLLAIYFIIKQQKSNQQQTKGAV